MKTLLKPFVRPIARRKLDFLYTERKAILDAIQRARRAKKRVSGLYEMAKRNTRDCHRWESWI